LADLVAVDLETKRCRLIRRSRRTSFEADLDAVKLRRHAQLVVAAAHEISRTLGAPDPEVAS
jgi:hypothetical protein